MVILLLIALVLVGSAVALALHGGAIRNRELLAQVGSYGFVEAPTATPKEAAGFGASLSRLAQSLGARVERRLGAERLRELRVLLNAAGYYRTSVTRYLG